MARVRLRAAHRQAQAVHLHQALAAPPVLAARPAPVALQALAAPRPAVPALLQAALLVAAAHVMA